MVDEVRQLAALVDFLAGAHYRFGQRSRTATEDADLADVAVLLLDEFEEGRHVGPAKVIDGLEAGEHAALGDALEVVLADVEHRRPQIEFVEELGDEDVHFQHVGHVLALHVAQDVDEPLKVSVRRAGPQEVDLLAGDARVAVGRRAKHQIVEDGRVGRHSDASAHHHGHFELVPVLIAAAKRAVQLDLGVHLLGVEVARVEIVAQFPRPRPLRLDVTRQKVLVGSRRQSERVELFRLDSGTGKTDPLARKVLEVGRAVELDFEHVRWQQDRLDNVQTHEFGPQADHLVQRVDDGRADHVEPEGGLGRESSQSVDDVEDVEQNVEAVGLPEEVVGLFADDGVSEDEDDDHDDKEEDARDARQSLEQPIGDGRLKVARQADLLRQAAQMFHRLSGHVVEVDDVSDRVQEREEEGRQGADLVELDVGVQRDVLLDGVFFEFGQKVARHGQQEETVAEGEGGRRSASDGDADAHDVAQVRVLRHERVVDEAVDKQGDRHHVEDEKVENVLSVLLQESCQFVPSAEDRVAVALLDGVDVEARHASHVGRSVQKVLLGAFAVEADGDEIAAIFAHHQLEILVVQGVLVLQAGRLEHAVDQFRHLVVVEAVVGAGNLHQRAQHLRQFALVDDAVAVVVAHVEDDAQFVFGAALGEEDDRVEEFLEGNPPVAVLVHNVEHHLDEHVVALHAQGAGELVAGKRRAHHHNDVARHVFQLPLLARLQAERQGVSLAEKVFQSLLAPLPRLRVRQHLLPVGRDLFQVFLVAGEERFQFVEESLARRVRVEFQDEVVVARNADQQHRLLTGVLRHLHRQHLDAFEIDFAQLLPLAVHRVKRLFRTEFHLHQSLVVQVQPLLHHHLVHRFPVVVLFVTGLQLAPLGILQFDDAVADAGGDDRHKGQEETAVDVRHFTSGKVIVADQEVAGRQRRGVELTGLRTRVAFPEEEDVLLNLSLADVHRGADHVVERRLADFVHLVASEHSVVGILEPETVSVADASQLFLDDGGEERTRPVDRLQHSADVDVDVVDVVAVEFGQFWEEVGLLGGQRRVNVRPVGDGTETETATGRVVVGQARVSSAHDVEGAQIASREFHGSEQFVAHVGAQETVLSFRQLRGHSEDEFLDRIVDDDVHRVPPGGAQADGRRFVGSQFEVALAVASVEARRDHRVPESECRTLENVADARMDIRFVSFVFADRLAKKRRNVLVHYNVLQMINKL